MLLLSTALYVADAQKSQLKYTSESDLYLPFYKQGLRHTIISALVNISNGGDTSVLDANLNQFNMFTVEHSYDAFFTSEFTLRNIAPYINGVWTTQNSSGIAVVSSYVSFSIVSSGTSETCSSAYDIEVTSRLAVSGMYRLLNGTEKQVELTCSLFNEGQAALAEGFRFSYENDGSLEPENWTLVEEPNIVDNGNGTYTFTFIIITDQPDDPVLVWVSCQDQRGILLQTLVTPTMT
jgi:hypothetical protein